MVTVAHAMHRVLGPRRPLEARDSSGLALAVAAGLARLEAVSVL